MSSPYTPSNAHFRAESADGGFPATPSAPHTPRHWRYDSNQLPPAPTHRSAPASGVASPCGWTTSLAAYPTPAQAAVPWSPPPFSPEQGVPRPSHPSQAGHFPPLSNRPAPPVYPPPGHLAPSTHAIMPPAFQASSPLHSYGPPLGVFSPSFHSAFDEVPGPRRHSHVVVPATPASLFGHAPPESVPSGNSAKRNCALTPSASGPSSLNGKLTGKAAAEDINGDAKKPPRDPKRRATHSQIERRRREKINDRLITLRNLVPACVQEVEERAKARLEEQQQAERIAAGLIASTTGSKGKRKRIRRKASALSDKNKDADKEPELGLHKLEVLTHTIDFIYILQARIEELETGKRPARIKRAEDDEEELMQEEVTAKEEDLERWQDDARQDQPAQQPAVENDEEVDELEAAEDHDVDADNTAPPAKRRASVNHNNDTNNTMHARKNSISAMSASSETSSEASIGPSTYENLSPMFPPTRTASSSMSSLTSPFMSMSATSPIFLNGKQTVQGGAAGVAASALTTLNKLSLPPSAMSSSIDAAGPSSQQQRAGPVRRDSAVAAGKHGTTSAVRAGDRDGEATLPSGTNGEDRSAAELLLAFSGSPENALRPSDISKSATSKQPRVPMARRSTTSSHLRCIPAFSTPQMRAVEESRAEGGIELIRHDREQGGAGRMIPGSAPGGSVATSRRRAGQEDLPSPPPLELDGGR